MSKPDQHIVFDSKEGKLWRFLYGDFKIIKENERFYAIFGIRAKIDVTAFYRK